MGREEVRRGGGHGQEEELLTPQVDSLAIALAPAGLRGSLAFGNPPPYYCPLSWTQCPWVLAAHPGSSSWGLVTPAGVPLEQSPFETA